MLIRVIFNKKNNIITIVKYLQRGVNLLTEIQTAVEAFNGGVSLLSGLIDVMSLALTYSLLIFLVTSVINLCLNKNDKKRVLEELMNILKYSFPLFLLKNTQYLGYKIIVLYLVLNLILILGYAIILKVTKNKTNNTNIEDKTIDNN